MKTHIYDWTGPIAAGVMTQDRKSFTFLSSKKLEVGQGVNVDGTSTTVRFCNKSFGGYFIVAALNEEKEYG